MTESSEHEQRSCRGVRVGEEMPGRRLPVAIGGALPLGTMLQDLRSLPPATWPRSLLYSAVAAALIAVPSDLIDTRFFGRPIETKAINYLILAVTAFLIGLIFAIRPEVNS